jgi:hypothetical protein
LNLEKNIFTAETPQHYLGKSERMKKTSILVNALLFSLTFLMVSSAPLSNAQSAGNVIINADGSVTGTYNMQQTGSTYTLTGNISGTIQVQKSNIVIDGAGYALENGGIDLTNGVGQNPTRPTISNVTVKNLYIVNGWVLANGGGNCTFYNDYISNNVRDACIMLIGSTYNNITHCTLKGTFNGTAAVGMVDGAAYNTITENNLTGGVNIFLSVDETIDRNYWSDYLTKYPNATEIDNSGIGNIPYGQDNHPLMKPVSITVPEFPSWAVLPLLIAMVTAVGFLIYFKKRKH